MSFELFPLKISSHILFIFLFNSKKKLLVRKPIAQLIRATSTTSSSNSVAVAASSSDEVGYQRPVRGIEAAPVRFGFVPEEW